jgi:uncharacterized protein (TIGR02246 family)
MSETGLASTTALESTESEGFDADNPPQGGPGTARDTDDAADFADLFTRDGSVFLPADGYVCMESRAEILAFMAAAYQCSYKQIGVVGAPLDVRYLEGNTTVMIT